LRWRAISAPIRPVAQSANIRTSLIGLTATPALAGPGCSGYPILWDVRNTGKRDLWAVGQQGGIALKAD